MKKIMIMENLDIDNIKDSIRLKSNIYKAYTDYIEYLITLLNDDNSIRENLEIEIEIGKMMRERKEFEPKVEFCDKNGGLSQNIEAVISSIGEDLANYKPRSDDVPFHDDMKYLMNLEALENWDDEINERYGAPQKVRK